MMTFRICRVATGETIMFLKAENFIELFKITNSMFGEDNDTIDVDIVDRGEVQNE